MTAEQMHLTVPLPEITVLPEVDSTNTRLKARLREAVLPHGTVLIARHQTAGRGRHGKTFHSPPGGLYFSAVFDPTRMFETTTHITAFAAVCVAETLESLGFSTRIKYVNDIFAPQPGGELRKVCGILTESGGYPDRTGGIDWIVVGIGINLYPLPDDLQTTANFPGALYPAPCADDPTHVDPATALAGGILNRAFAPLPSWEEVRAQYLSRLIELPEGIEL